MWRSLFYSAGIGLFVLGLQTLVIDYVVVPKNTKVQKLVRKILSDDGPADENMANPQSVAGRFGDQNSVNWTAQQAPVQPFGQAYGSNSESRFGPSRFGQSQFSGPAYGTGYGGARMASPQGGATQFNGYPPQGNTMQLAGFRADGSNGVAVKKPVQMQNFKIREWMPWSLLASGAIIFLYTHTIHRRGFQD